MDQTSISAVVAVGAVSAIIFNYIGYSRGVKKDTFSVGRTAGEQQADTTYIKKRVDDILLEQRDTNRKLEGHGVELSDHAVKIARLEESSKSAHKRIDTLEEKGAHGSA